MQSSTSTFAIDERAQVCQVCRNTKFSLMKRRHLCFRCGRTICANCGIASASSFTAVFRKKERESNVCILCQRSGAAAAGGPGVRSGAPADTTNNPGGALRTQNQQQQHSDPNGSQPPKISPRDSPRQGAVIPVQKALPASQRSTTSEGKSSHQQSQRRSDYPSTANAGDNTSSGAITMSATPAAQGSFVAQPLDWAVTDCCLCSRGFTAQRRRCYCDGCHRTVCSECRIQRAGSIGSLERSSSSMCTQCTATQSTAIAAAAADATSIKAPDNSLVASSIKRSGSSNNNVGNTVSGSTIMRVAQQQMGSSALQTMLPPVQSMKQSFFTGSTIGNSSIVANNTGGAGIAASFRPTSMMRRAAAPTARQIPGASGVTQTALQVEVGSVRKKGTGATTGGLAASFRAGGAMMSTALAGSIRNSNNAAFVLGTTPMGSLPAQFFLAKQQSLGSASIAVDGSAYHRLLHEFDKTSSATAPSSGPSSSSSSSAAAGKEESSAVIGTALQREVLITDIFGPIARDHLRACVDLLIERHPILRTSFVKGQLQVFPSATADFRFLSQASFGTYESAEKTFLFEVNKPFDVDHVQTLLRVRLLDHQGKPKEETSSNSKANYTLALVFHRAIACHGSISVFLSDLKILYQNAYQIIEKVGVSDVRINESVLRRVLPRQPAAYETYCVEERERLASPASTMSRQYWIEQMQRRVRLELPFDKPRGALFNAKTLLQSVAINAATSEHMNNFAKKASAPLPVCYLTAFAILLQRYTQQDAVTVAVQEQLHRDVYEDTMGPMVNYTLHTILSDERTCALVANSVSLSMHDAESHRTYPFTQALRDSSAHLLDTSGCKVAIADACFAHEPSDWGSFLHGVDGAITSFAGMEWRSTSRLRGKICTASPFDIVLHFWDVKGRAHCAFEYNASVFHADSMVRLAENFAYLLRHIAERGGEAHTNHTAPLIAPHQMQQLLYAHNENSLMDTGAMLTRGRGVLSLLRESFLRCRDLPALAMPEEGPHGASLTYSELDERSNMIAHMLRREYNAKANCVVAIAMPRCVTQMVCVLGVLKAGAAYLPLDISYPPDRLEFMLSDSQVICVFTSDSTRNGDALKGLFDHCPAPVLPIADHFETIITERFSEFKAVPLEDEIDPDDTTYVIYTSGSTGKPKGVVMNHRALTNLVLWQHSYLPWGDNNVQQQQQLRTLQFSPISFDVSFQELFTTWHTGGALFMVSESLRLDPVRLIVFLNEHHIHRIFLPFVALSHICETALETGVFPSTLMDLITAGEQLVISRPLIECIERLQRTNRVTLHNHYGPSETHVCSYYVLEGNPKTWLALPPIGKPIANTQLYVTDDKRQLVPYGVIGELFIAGDCLGTGYLGRPDATDAAFVSCPFPSATSSKMYKTGDLVQMLPDGNILYVRRKDTQVKVRGFRIELGEIEAKLSQHDTVKKCCVVVRDDDGDKKIVAYVVTQKSSLGEEDRVSATAQLRAFLKSSMPDYMVPSFFMFLSTMPLTPSGKINRKGLPKPSIDESHLGVGGAAGSDEGATVPLEGETQVQLSRIWAEVLKRPAATIYQGSNFFDLGGHSLTITKVASRVAAFYGAEVALSSLFKNPVLKDQAKQIEVELNLVTGGATNPSGTQISKATPLFSPVDAASEGIVSSGSDKGPPPMTFNQQSLVFLCMSRPESAAVYNISMQGYIRGGSISATELSDVFETVLKQHPSLRTTYHQDENGVFYQTVHDHQELDVNIIQLDESDLLNPTVPSAEGDGSMKDRRSVAVHDCALKELIKAEGNRPFHLSTDSMMRIRMYLLPNNDMVLQLIFHHVAVDLWSLDLIMDDVIGALGGVRSGGGDAFTMSKRPSTYTDYARYQLAMEERGTLSRSAVAWRQLLDLPTAAVGPAGSASRELPVLDLPTDYPRPLLTTFRGAIKVFTFPKALNAALRQMVHGGNTTMYVALMSMIFVTLHKYSRQEEIIVGTPMACRNVQRFEQTVGYFINAIPIRMCFPGHGQTMGDVLATCKQYLMNALEHQDYPFPLIADKIVGARSASRSPVFQTLFTFQSAPLHDDLVPFVMYQEGHKMNLGPNCVWESISVPNGHAMYDIVFQFADLKSSPEQLERGEGERILCGTLEYNADLFSPETIDSLTDVFLWVAEQCCKNPTTDVSMISTAVPSQTETLVKTFNANPRSVNDKMLTAELGPQHTVSVNDPGETIVRVIERVAQLHPNRVAATFGFPDTIPGGTGIKSMTFEELDKMSNRIARHIRTSVCPDLHPGDIVSVSIRRSLEMIAVMLAVMKTGAAYVPVDPAYPQDRIEYMTSDSDSRFTICRRADAQVFPSQARVVCLEDILEESEGVASDRLAPPLLEREIRNDDLAYVIYTSGSTGKPKGTLLEHKGLVNLSYSIKHAYRMKYGESRFLLFASSSFDASVLEIFCPLAIASTVVMLAEGAIVGEVLARAMAATDVTVAVLPPSVLSVMSEEFFPPPKLEVLVTAGEAINDELLARWRSKVCMLNGYGPTENTVCTTVCDYDEDHIVLLATHAKFVEYQNRLLSSARSDSHRDIIVKQPPIGKPLANYRCYVLDENSQLCGVGVPGELVVSGPGVARGYHKLPEKTSACFVPNPFDQGVFDRMYHTGDLVRWLSSGQIEFMGRIDQQVKLRGYRIELGEIESVILKFEGAEIVDCAVDIRVINTGKALVAYMVVKSGETQPLVADLKSWLRKSLPDYMVPSAFVTVPSLPLTPSGKVDRKALPAPFQGASQDKDALDKPAPQNPTQAVLLVLAKEVLGSNTVGISDDFFDVGGHSLAGMQLVSRIRDHLGVEVTIAKLFELSKLTSLADYIEAQRSNGEAPLEITNHFVDEPGQVVIEGGDANSSMVMKSIQNRFPLSYNQESLWFAYTMDRSCSTFNVAFAAKLGKSPALDELALEKALTATVLLNPMLRVAFDAQDAAPSQLVSSTQVSVTIGKTQIETSSTTTVESEIEHLCHQPLHLEAGEVFRVCLASHGTDTYMVVLFHHIISDLGSMETFLKQLGVLYASAVSPNGLLHGMPLRQLQTVQTATKQQIMSALFGGVGVASVSYIDFVYYQRELISSTRGERLFNYWQRQLSGYPSFTALPTDHIRPARPSFRGGAACRKIEPTLVAKVLKTAKALSTTPLTIYLTTLYTWLFRVTGQTDVVVGMPVSSRTKSELEHVIGDFVNLCPLRLQLDSLGEDSAEEAPSFRFLAKKAKGVLIGALTNQEYPFQLLVQNLQQYRDPSRAPIFQVLLVHEKPHHSFKDLAPFVLGDAGGSLSLADGALQLHSVGTKERTCPYDLVFALSEGEDDLVNFRIQYALDLYHQETVERFAAQFTAVLEAAVDNLSLPYTKLSLVPKEETAAMNAINAASRLPLALATSVASRSKQVEDTVEEHQEASSSRRDECLPASCLHVEFEVAAAAFANQTALSDAMGRSYTYEMVNALSNGVARIIRARVRGHLNLQEEEGDDDNSTSSSVVKYSDFPVCIFIPRSVEYVISVVAAAKANTPYTPIDIKIPAARATFIMEDTQCIAVLTISSLVDEVKRLLAASASESRHKTEVIAVDTLIIEAETLLIQGGSGDSDAAASPTTSAARDALSRKLPNTSSWIDCLYTIYTSGSTGMPKGVMIHHGGVVNVCKWFAKEHKVVPGDVSAQALGAAFDPVTIELWPYLISGASVVIMDDDSKFGGPEATVAFLHKHRVTHITFPTVLSQIIFDTVSEFPKDFQMRSWSCGGDKFRGTKRALPFSLINAYGPTECCVLCSQYPINFPVRSREEHTGEALPPQPDRISVEPPLGTPTANTALYILDAYGNPVPRGVVGELCVGGAQVGIGYRNRPDASEKVFTPDLFNIHASTSRPPARIYHTGDLVRMDEEYNIHFIGRRDFQVKIRGFRIELGEIEAQLLHATDRISHVVCIAHQPESEDTSTPQEKQLVAFLRVVDGALQETDGAKLREAARSLRAEVKQTLKGKLPDYMVPHVIIVLRDLPFTPNGKVDRAALPEYIKKDLCGGADSGGSSSSNESGSPQFVPPKTIEEQKMCSIWEELLRTKPIGLTDNWYDKGGSSLTSTMLLSRMRQVFQMEVSIQHFFADPTVNGLLRIVREKGNATVAHSLVDVLERDAQDLPPSITAHRSDLIPYDPDSDATPSNVFITGVTGFLGAFILRQLLDSLPTANIYCLVRAKTESDASARIFKNLDAYQLLDNGDVEQWMDRVIPVVGDLAVESFGLSASRFVELSTVVDCIIHNGALVNFSYPYVSLKAANVGGTTTVLKLATMMKLKPVHFISTLSTVPTPDRSDSKVVSERVLGKAGEDLHGGYTQTKWVAERLVSLAATRGVPCTIIRPGRITGHSQTGACNLDDFLTLFMKGCVEMGCAPLLEMPCEMTPVDFCALAIAEIALRHFTLHPAYLDVKPISSSYVYHLTNTSAMPWNKLMQMTVKQGNFRDLTFMPYKEWREQHLLMLNNTSHCSLIPLVPMFGEDFEKEVAPLEIRVDHLTSLLRRSGVSCPETNEALVSVYIRYFIEKGVFPAAGGGSRAKAH